MRSADTDIDWLRFFFPSLVYDSKAQKITGELSFCACYDEATKEVRIELLDRDDDIRKSQSFLCDVFEIEISLEPAAVESNGWPRVREVGGRYRAIAQKCNVEVNDLHFFPDGACCLGIQYSEDPNLTLQGFLSRRVIPFFYRLSYTDRFGIDASCKDLWGEYTHGDKGFREHEKEMLAFARLDPGRNTSCPCGSGIKYKKCCLDEVQAVRRQVGLRQHDDGYAVPSKNTSQFHSQ